MDQLISRTTPDISPDIHRTFYVIGSGHSGHFGHPLKGGVQNVRMSVRCSGRAKFEAQTQNPISVSKGTTMTNVVPFECKPTNYRERAAEAWQKALNGEGMTFRQAYETLIGIDYNPEWTPEELYEATPADMREQVLCAMRVMAGSQHAGLSAMEAYRACPDGDA